MNAQLGDRVKHKISGFTGIVVSVTRYLQGCDRCAVQPEELNKDGAPYEWQSFDITELEVTAREIHKPEVGVSESFEQKPLSRVTGGPRPDTPRRRRGSKR